MGFFDPSWKHGSLPRAAWETHTRFNELKKTVETGMSDNSRKQRETAWTKRAGYKRRKKFTTDSMLPWWLGGHSTPPSPPTNLPILWQVSFNHRFQCLSPFHSGFHQGDPLLFSGLFSGWVSKCWQQPWFYFCTPRQRGLIFRIAWLGAFSLIYPCM